MGAGMTRNDGKAARTPPKNYFATLWWWLRAQWHLCHTRRGRWQSPFCGARNRGGWRTRLCDWLEARARATEEHE